MICEINNNVNTIIGYHCDSSESNPENMKNQATIVMILEKTNAYIIETSIIFFVFIYCLKVLIWLYIFLFFEFIIIKRNPIFA